ARERPLEQEHGPDERRVVRLAVERQLDKRRAHGTGRIADEETRRIESIGRDRDGRPEAEEEKSRRPRHQRNAYVTVPAPSTEIGARAQAPLSPRRERVGNGLGRVGTVRKRRGSYGLSFGGLIRASPPSSAGRTSGRYEPRPA